MCTNALTPVSSEKNIHKWHFKGQNESMTSVKCAQRFAPANYRMLKTQLSHHYSRIRFACLSRCPPAYVYLTTHRHQSFERNATFGSAQTECGFPDCNSSTIVDLWIRFKHQPHMCNAFADPDSSHTSENSGSSDSQAMHLQLTDSDLRSRILEAALDYVQEYGWSRNAVEAACVAGGFPPGMHTMVTPQGGVDLVLYFYASRNQQLADTMVDWRTSDSSSSSASVDDGLPRFSSPAEMDAFLYRALKFRLEKITPVLPVWPQALGLLALPSNMPSSIGLLAQLVDEIWAQCGDRTTDVEVGNPLVFTVSISICTCPVVFLLF
ncbi:rpsU-divergently transcribed protein [Opisthorchis viverrini]|uniref:Ubiquinone biosynthesis protein n=1 Tax=Opisthorchis viverrini TaxID=6198 RepID=A0A1S8WGS3_OPIVI|nr:rpsU-divergently transcribed protein [Opisthorchis viverrini]